MQLERRPRRFGDHLARGCIIRAQFLNPIRDAYDKNPDLPSLLLDPYFPNAVESGVDAWRRVVATAATMGIPTPAFASSLAYYDGLRAPRLNAALTQGLRDYFGAHTYRRHRRRGELPHPVERRPPEVTA